MRRPQVAVYAAFLVLFVILSYLAHQPQYFPGDRTVIELVDEAVSPGIETVLHAVSHLGTAVSAAITVAVAVAVLLVARRRLEALFVGALPAVAWLVSSGFKVLVDRARPGADLLGGGTSFPSGHTTYATVLGGVIFYLAPRLLNNPGLARVVQALMVLFVVLMGASRVALGAHWPSDIAGSYLLGGLLLAPAIALYNRHVRVTRDEPEAENA